MLVYRRAPRLLAGLGACLLSAAVRPAQAQLSQITSCIEFAPLSSSTRSGDGADCNPQAARSEALQRARAAARDARAGVCTSNIDSAEAAAACRAAGGVLPGSATTSVQGPSFAVPGGASIDGALGIGGSDPKLCTVLRDGGVSSSTVTNLLCLFNGFQETLASASSTARCGVQCFDVHQHRLSVRRFTASVLSAADADRILADATAVLRTDDGAGDVGCVVAMMRSAAVSTFGTGDGSLDSAAELDAVMNLSGNIKVVEAINFCGGIGAGIIGCGRMPGSSFVVVRLTPELEGLVWAHEFGHNQGLPHRSDLSAIMNPFLAATARGVQASECSAYRGGTSLALESPDDLEAAGAGVETEPPAARAFVRRLFVHGVPYELAARYDADEVHGLLKLLGDPAQRPYWSNVAAVLGMAGDERVVAPLLDFIAGGEALLDREHYRAKTTAVLSLGYLVQRLGDIRALDYLLAGLRAENWSERRVGQPAHLRTARERDQDLVKYAALGLALSGRPEAEHALEELLAEAERQPSSEFPARIAGKLAQILEEHRKIAARGLADYYRARP